MSMREKVLIKLATRGRLITTVASVACCYMLCIMPAFSKLGSVEEDTIYPGGTLPFVRAEDFNTGTHPEYKYIAETPYFVHQATRDDGREGLVYVFMGAEAAKIGYALAAALRRVEWLSKDVYFVFPKKTKELKEWLHAFYRGGVGTEEKPIIRGAFVLELANSGPHYLEMSVEGINGILPNEDWGNVLFEVASDLGITVNVRPLYESIVYQGLNGGIGKAHTVFLDYAIPALGIANQRNQKRGPVRSLQVAQLVGRHLRAVSGLHLQLHHSTSWYFYTGFTSREISMGLFLPLLIGLFSPLIVAVVDLNGHTELPIYSLALMGHVLAGVIFIGGSCFALLVYMYGPTNPIRSDPALIGISVLIALPIVAHVLTSRWLQKKFDSDPNNICIYDFPKTFSANVHKVYCLILVSLTLLHWSLALLVTLLVLPMLLLAAPLGSFSQVPRACMCLASVVFSSAALFCLISGTDIYARQAFGDAMQQVLANLQGGPWWAPTDLIHFLREWAYRRISLGKSIKQHVNESMHYQGLALPVLIGTFVPAIIFVVEIAFAKPGNTKVGISVVSPKLLNSRRVALLVVAASVMAYQIYSS